MVLSNLRLKIDGLVQKHVSHETSILDIFEFVLILVTTASIFFPIRYVFEAQSAYALGYYSDFTAISVYLGQITAFLLFGVVFYRNWSSGFIKIVSCGTLLFVCFGFIWSAVDETQSTPIIWHFLSKIYLVALFAYSIYLSKIWLKYKDFFIFWLIIAGLLQSIITIAQFALQSSLGLTLLGESEISIFTLGVAKIVSHGTTYIRSYGTLPHPNVLAGLLVITNILNLYLLNKSKQGIKIIFLVFSHLSLTMAIFLTFSRTGLLALGLSTTFFLTFLYKYVEIKQILKNFTIVAVGFLISASVLSNFLVSRANILDSSAKLRSSLFSAGYSTIKQNWLLGTSPGTNLFHMKQQLADILPIWDIQPIHNTYLLIISELGLIGLAILILYLYFLYRVLIKTLSQLDPSPDRINWLVSLAIILVAISVLFMFDHYFYTLWPGNLMLALIIGLIMREIFLDKKPA